MMRMRHSLLPWIGAALFAVSLSPDPARATSGSWTVRFVEHRGLVERGGVTVATLEAFPTSYCVEVSLDPNAGDGGCPAAASVAVSSAPPGVTVCFPAPNGSCSATSGIDVYYGMLDVRITAGPSAALGAGRIDLRAKSTSSTDSRTAVLNIEVLAPVLTVPSSVPTVHQTSSVSIPLGLALPASWSGAAAFTVFAPAGLSAEVTPNPAASPVTLSVGATRGILPGPSSLRLLVELENGDGVSDNVTPLVHTIPLNVALAESCGNGLVDAGELCWTQTAFGVGTVNPSKIALADFDGDGRLDIAVLDRSNISVKIYGNAGAGSFPLRTTLNASGGFGGLQITQAFDLAIGDANVDGRSDVYVALDRQDAGGKFATGAVRIFTNNGGFSFSLRSSLPSGGNGPLSIAVGNLDASIDGSDDWIVANARDLSIVRQLLIPFNLNWSTPLRITLSSKPFQVSLADLDGDGQRDAIVHRNGDGCPAGQVIGGCRTEKALDLFAVTGNGTMTLVDTLRAGTDFSLAHALGDLDGDGDHDLAITSPGDVQLRRNDGNFTFTTPAAARTLISAYSVPVGDDPRQVLIADIDSDVQNDLIAVNRADQSLSLVTNAGSTPAGYAFAEPITFALPGSPYAAAVGDLNGDGELDVAATVGNTIQLLLSSK